MKRSSRSAAVAAGAILVDRLAFGRCASRWAWFRPPSRELGFYRSAGNSRNIRELDKIRLAPHRFFASVARKRLLSSFLRAPRAVPARPGLNGRLLASKKTVRAVGDPRGWSC